MLTMLEEERQKSHELVEEALKKERESSKVKCHIFQQMVALIVARLCLVVPSQHKC